MNPGKSSTLRWLWAVPGKKKLNILFLTVLQALHGASGVLYALLLREIVDAAVEHNAPGFWRFLLFTILLAAVQLLLRALIRWLSELSKSGLENTFKSRFVDTLLHKDFLRVSAVHTGEWLNRLTNDTKVIADGYVDIVPGLAGMVVKLISALVMIIVLEPRFAAILIPAGALMLFCTWLFRKKLKRLHKRIQEADGRLRVFLQERIGSLFMIHSFAAEEQMQDDTEQKLQAHKAARMRRNRFSNLANIGFGTAMSGMYLLGVGWCGYGILIGTISFGTLTAITQLITQIQMPFANITGYLPRYYAMLASAERLMEAEAFPGDVQGPEKSGYPGDTKRSPDSADTRQADCPGTEENPASVKDIARVKPLSAILEFYQNRLTAFGLKDVSFAYYPAAEGVEEIGKDSMPVVLKGLSLEIKKGEYVAFTGHSGCGKSTALKLLMCVYRPDGGERYYTACEWADALSDRSHADMYQKSGELTSAYRRLFAYVPQGNALMNGTIREVVSFADPEASRDEERLTQALRIACAEEFISELSEGIDTLLGERGTGLSEGQMQRLAIARAIFSGSPILLLDEATSALDAGTERRLLDNLRMLTDKTVVIVTHRTAALAICDRVLEFTEHGVTSRDA